MIVKVINNSNYLMWITEKFKLIPTQITEVDDSYLNSPDVKHLLDTKQIEVVIDE